MTTPRPALLACALGVLASGLAACGRGRVEAPPEPTVTSDVKEEPGRMHAHEAVTVSATVQDVNPETRVVKLRGSDDEEIAFRAGPDVENLEQVRRGDVVQVTYYQSVAIELRKRGQAERGVETSSGVDRAEPGEKPGGVVTKSTQVTAEIVDIDKKRRTVTLRGPEGDTRMLPVENPEHLDVAKVGDLVEVTYTEAIGIKVEPPND